MAYAPARRGGEVPSRRFLLLALPAVALGGCFDEPCEERNSQQKAFLDGLKSLAKPALASGNPLQIEEAARQSVALADRVGAFAGWCGTVTKIEGAGQTVAVTIDVGRQVSLFAFNDWTRAFAGSVLDLFSSRSGSPPPPGLSDAALAALKTLRLGERVSLSGRLGQIAGSSLPDWSRLFGKGEAEHRQFLQAPRFVARLEAVAAEKKK